MKSFALVSSIICPMAFAVSLYAAGPKNLIAPDKVGSDRSALPATISEEPALIGSYAYRSQPGWEPHVFCLAQTPEQIGFVIATLEALAIDGVLIHDQGDAFIFKLQSVRFQGDAVNALEVSNQLEEFIIKADLMIQRKKITSTQGQRVIDSTLGVVCRG